MESVSSTFLIFYPSIFQHRNRFSISSTNFFLLYLNIVRCLLLSETGMCDKSSGTCIVKHQWLNPSVLISCSHAKKKKKLSQAVLIPGTHGADYFPINMQHPAEQTQNIILSASSCYHLASEEILTTLEKKKRRMSFWEASR